MAEIIPNEKDFKVIKVSLSELRQAFGGYGICDYCGSNKFTGYYIAVLNHWYCENDFKRFLKNAYNYPEDRNIEQANFENAKTLLNL